MFLQELGGFFWCEVWHILPFIILCPQSGFVLPFFPSLLPFLSLNHNFWLPMLILD